MTTGQGPDTGVVQVHRTKKRGPGIPYGQSSRAIGDAIAALLRPRAPRRILVDLAGLWVHDAGAGLLAALGASADRPLDQGVAGLDGLSELDLAPARALLGDTELVGVSPLHSSASRCWVYAVSPLMLVEKPGWSRRHAPNRRRPRSLRPAGFTTHAGAPGAGACGGLGFAVLALGGRLTTGPALTLASAAGEQELRGVGLVVTGCSVFDFASRGGGIVSAMAEAAAAALVPCIVIADEVLIRSREMRTWGSRRVPSARVAARHPAGRSRRRGACDDRSTVFRRARRWWPPTSSRGSRMSWAIGC